MTQTQKRKVLIVGEFTYSKGEAGANYVIGLGNALHGAGCDVEYVSPYAPQSEVRADFRRFACHVAEEESLEQGWRHRWSRLRASGDGILKWLARRPLGEQYTVIAYPPRICSVGFLSRLRGLCRRRGWKLIVAVVEWYAFGDLNRMSLPRRLYHFLDMEFQLRVVNRQIGHIIAVSSCLKRFYDRLGCNTVRVPPLIDAAAEKWKCRPVRGYDGNGLRLLFSGSWERERVDILMAAVERLGSEGHEVQLEFLGSSQADLTNNVTLAKQTTSAANGAFRFHGRVPLEEVPPITAAADFGVLLRRRARWSEACFPSKVGEFQALGVPLLCNLTSDLGDALKDGDNALIVPHLSATDFIATVKRALALSPMEREHLAQSSLRCAATYFDYRHFAGTLNNFLCSI